MVKKCAGFEIAQTCYCPEAAVGILNISYQADSALCSIYVQEGSIYPLTPCSVCRISADFQTSGSYWLRFILRNMRKDMKSGSAFQVVDFAPFD